ncbi:MAG: 2-hydroxy-3-oxopropionate reductase [Gammaproteobacteria bacterium]|nr:2-hydroxy-3-oxopropionate reductase [Gammaproteobacteria bacterium]MBL7000229.1 2-hydroxy-3-oxopropionate reductase [Gammaproteobacteria bacterium]
MRIGFIGLGVMGKPMSSHLMTAGHSLYSCTNVSDIHPDLLAQGLHICASPAAVAEKSAIIFTMLPDTSDVEKVLLGENGILSSIRAGKVIVDMSSISPSETIRFAYRANEAGCEYLDAPVSGGQSGAEAASLSIMVGGDPKTFAQIKPLFALLGKNITRVGDVGTGQICKIANQMIVAINIEAVAEALVLVSKAGADPELVRQALMGGSASSRVLEKQAVRMIKRQFEPGFRVDLHRKDLKLALNTAQELGLSLPNTAVTLQLLNSCAAEQNGGSLDHSSLILALEKAASHAISH